MRESWEDYGKKWMHFVYKLDHLFQSTRVSDENSSVTRLLSLFQLASKTCNIQIHILKFQPFLTSFDIFHAFHDLFSAKWPWNWKGIQPELRKGWNLAWCHYLTHITCAQKLRGLRQNWMHFVYKLDHLFQSTRASDENSSVTKTFHFSKLISTQDFFCIQHATFKATYWNFNPFWLHLLFFMHLMIYFELNDLEIRKHNN